MKKIASLTLALLMILTFSINALATEIDVPYGYGQEYSTPENPFVFIYEAEETPVFNSNSRSGVLEYGYVTSTSNVNVYTSTDKTTSIGYVGYRERIYVFYVAGSMYYIEFMNVNTLDRGFIDADKITFPSYGWKRPITTGTVSCDFGEDGHAGIDIAAATGTPIYAVKNASYESIISTANFDGVKKFVNYGNHIICETNDKTIVYGHLSSFAQGTAGSYDSYRVKYTGTPDYESKATWTASAGDQIGTTGNTGWSRGAHLHFEIYKTSNYNYKYDPFAFVVFPNVGYN